MNRKELIIEIRQHPLVDKMISEGHITEKDLLEFILLEVNTAAFAAQQPRPQGDDFTDQYGDSDIAKRDKKEKARKYKEVVKAAANAGNILDQRAPADRNAAEIARGLNPGWLDRFLNKFSKMSGDFSEKMLKLVDPDITDEDVKALTPELDNFFTRSNAKKVVQAIEKQSARRREKERAGGPRTPGQSIKNLPLAASMAISQGGEILRIIKKIDAAVKWDSERNVPDAILSQQIPDDDTKDAVEKQKQEDIKKYKELKNKIEYFEKLVTPQVNIDPNNQPIAGKLSPEQITVWDFSRLKETKFWSQLQRDDLGKFNQVEDYVSTVFQTKSENLPEGIKPFNELFPNDEELKKLDHTSFLAMAKFISNVGPRLKALKDELSSITGQTKNVSKAGSVQQYFKDAGLNTPENILAKDYTLGSLFPKYEEAEA